jgi:hypothetical protein
VAGDLLGRVRAELPAVGELGGAGAVPGEGELIAKAREVNRRLLQTMRVSQDCVPCGPSHRAGRAATSTENGRVPGGFGSAALGSWPWPGP